MAWLPDGEKISKIPLFVLTWSTNLTDARTDGHQLTAYTALMHTHRAVKTLTYNIGCQFATQQLFIYPPTYVLQLHYLGETSQLYSNKFSNQSYTLPWHTIKHNIQFFHTAGLHSSLNITASVQNVLFHPHRPEVSCAIHQQHHPQCFATSINRALPRVGHVLKWSLIRSILHHTAHLMVSWIKVGLFGTRMSRGINIASFMLQ